MNVFHGSKKKKRMRKIKFQNLQENCLIWEMKLLIFLKKDFFPYKDDTFKAKEEESEEESEEKSEKE